MVTMMIDSMSIGLVIPVVAELLKEVTQLPAKDSALYGNALFFVTALMQFFFSPVLGTLSDRFGRRPILLISLAVLVLDHLLAAVAGTLLVLFIARLLTGIFSATFGVANAYIADITSKEERAKYFGMLGAAWGTGFVLGPIIGGLIGEYGTRIPFYVAAGLAAINVLYGLLVLPETLKRENRSAFSFKRANPVGSIWNLRRFPVVIPLVVASFFYMVAHDVNPTSWVFYTTHKFGWTSAEIGLSLTLTGLCIILVMGVLTGRVVKRFGEYKAAYFGFGLGALGYLGMAFAPSGIWMYASIPLFAMFGMGSPSVRSIMSAQVPENAQGALQGGISSVTALGSVCCPLLVGPLFNTFAQPGFAWYFPGVAQLLGALFLLLAMGAVWFSSRRRTTLATEA